MDTYNTHTKIKYSSDICVENCGEPCGYNVDSMGVQSGGTGEGRVPAVKS